MPSRRAVLVGSAVAMTPGCSALFGGCRYKWVVEAVPFDPVDDVPADLDGPAATLAERAIRDGTASVELLGGAPIRDGTFVEREGSFYRIDLVSETEERIPALEVDLEWEDGRTPTDDGPIVPYEDLPANDRAALDYAVHGDSYDTEGFPSSSLRFRDHRLAYPDGLAGSRLASLDHAWVDWEGRAFEITVHGEAQTSRYTYRYEATEVAADADAFRELMADERITSFSRLSAEERAIVDEAVEDRYEECTEREDERSRALQRFHERVERHTGNEFGSLQVAYEGEWYTLRVDSIVNEF